MPPPLMGPSPASPHRPSFFFSSASSPMPLSAADEWFFANSDRDTHILTQALTHELSTPCSISSSLCETQNYPSGLLEDKGFDQHNWSGAGHLVRALQQQQQQKQHQQQSPQQQTGTATATAGALATRMATRHLQDSFHSSLERGSPPSSNSHSPLSAASNPGSPYSNSTITTTNSAMSIPLHQDSQEGCLASPLVSHNNTSRTASLALSSQASLGAAETKVCKRRSRASNRSPISVLLTDVSNFRAMVQQLTGIPSITPSMQSLYGTSSLLKPHPTKHQYTDAASLPTLDTSACFLRPKPTMKDPLQGFSLSQRSHHLPSSLPSGFHKPGSTQGRKVEGLLPRADHIHLYAKQSVFGDKASVLSSSSILPSIWDYSNSAISGGNFASTIESQPTSYSTKAASQELEEYIPTMSEYDAGDAWLSFDGVRGNRAPKTEIARMA